MRIQPPYDTSAYNISLNKEFKDLCRVVYLIHEKSQSLDVFKSFKIEVELQLRKKIETVKFYHDSEYYGRYDESFLACVELFRNMTDLSIPRCPRPFALFSQSGEALNTIVYILNRVSSKAVNNTTYELLTCKRSFFETRNMRFLEEVEFEKEESIRNVVFEEESINDIGQVLKDYDEVLPQTPTERSIREMRHAISYDYIGLTQDDPINFCQAMCSSNS
ncbi:hypothetical protein CR513_50992, partial [Mucuna pruriens]